MVRFIVRFAEWLLKIRLIQDWLYHMTIHVESSIQQYLKNIVLCVKDKQKNELKRLLHSDGVFSGQIGSHCHIKRLPISFYSSDISILNQVQINEV